MEENNTCCMASDYVQIIDLLEVKMKKLNDNAKIPTRGSTYAAGYDLYANLEKEKIEIEPHTTQLIKTGIAMALPEGTFLGIYPRSGLASKKGLRPANCVGVIDSDYRGEIMVALHNDSNKIQIIENNERIAQAILQTFLPLNIKLVEELPTTERGEGGFGSTGSK